MQGNLSWCKINGNALDRNKDRRVRKNKNGVQQALQPAFYQSSCFISFVSCNVSFPNHRGHFPLISFFMPETFFVVSVLCFASHDVEGKPDRNHFGPNNPAIELDIIPVVHSDLILDSRHLVHDVRACLSYQYGIERTLSYPILSIRILRLELPCITRSIPIQMMIMI